MIDTFTIEDFIPDQVTQVNSIKWKNVDLFIRLNSSGNCCGCSTRQLYVIDANGKFETVFKTLQYIDDGEEQAGFESNMSIPLDPEVNDIGYTEYEYGGLYNINNKPILNKDGKIKTGTIKDSIKHYMWDGYRILEKDKK